MTARTAPGAPPAPAIALVATAAPAARAAPAEAAPPPHPAAPPRAAPARRRGRARGIAFALVVLLPTLLGALHAFVLAADQYVSEAQFWVRSSRPAQASLLGGLLAGTGLASSAEEALAVQSYARSHDAVRALEGRVGLRAIYGRPEADWLNRLPEDASLERLVEFHRRMVEVRHDDRSGIATLRVHAFRPEDARAVAEALLQLSEALVNRFSQRATEDSLRVARAEVDLAERRAAEARAALERFRAGSGELDLVQAGAAVRGIVATLEGQLAQLRAEIGQRSAVMRADAPALAALRGRAEALEQEIARERARLAGEAGAIAAQLGGYERLVMQRELADRALASAVASLEQARLEAQRQQLWLVRVVEPQAPEEPLFPRRWLLLAGIAGAALLAYGIGSLAAAAVRDHMV